jgi:hypothetical protein
MDDLFNQTLCFNEQGDIDSVYKNINKFIQQEDSDEAYFLLGKIQKDKIQEPLHWVLLFDAEYGMAEYDKAKNTYVNHLKDINNEEVDTKYILILLKEDDVETAEKTLESKKFTNKDNINYLKGVIAFKKKKYYSAMNYLKKVSKDNDNYFNAELYLSELCFNTGRFECSNRYFNAISSVEPGYSNFKLQDIKNNRLSVNFTAVLGEQFDSNVTSVDQHYTGISEKESARTYLMANIDLGYRFKHDFIVFGKSDNYAAWNYSAPDYNARIHNLGVGLVKKFDNFDIKLPEVEYEMTYMDDISYLDALKVSGAVNFYLDDFIFNLPVYYENKNFKDGYYQSERDSDVYSGGLGLTYIFNSKFISDISISYDQENADDEYFDNNKTTADLFVTYIFSDRFKLDGEYEYSYYDYKNSRTDHHNRATVVATIRITDMFSLAFDGSYIDHESNFKEHRYDKYVMGASVIFEY